MFNHTLGKAVEKTEKDLRVHVQEKELKFTQHYEIIMEMNLELLVLLKEQNSFLKSS